MLPGRTRQLSAAPAVTKILSKHYDSVERLGNIWKTFLYEVNVDVRYGVVLIEEEFRPAVLEPLSAKNGNGGLASTRHGRSYHTSFHPPQETQFQS